MKNKFLSLKFQPRLFLFLFFGFILTTAIGTITHEGGHYIASKVMGYDARIHYGYTSFMDRQAPPPEIARTVQKYRQEIIAGKAYPGKEQYDLYLTKFDKAHFWLTLGGPLQTIFTGTIGLLVLFISRKKYADMEALPWRRWLLIFLSLFWLRQSANWVYGLTAFLFTGRFSIRDDETKLALDLGLPKDFLITLTAIIGFGVLATVLFRFIPKSNRFTFIVAGLTGGISGFILWLEILGPVMMP